MGHVNSFWGAILVVAFALGLVTGCGDSSADNGDGANGASSSADDAGGGAAADTVTFELTITGGPLMGDVEGFELCLKDDPDTCATSDAAGVVSLEVPSNSRVPIHVDKEGFFPATYLLTTASDDIAFSDAFAFPTNDSVAEQAAAAGVTLDDSKGMFACVANTSTGGTVSLSPEGGDGPFYTDEQPIALPDLSLDAFSNSGVVFYYNLDPGEYDITISVPGKVCASNEMFWAASAPGVLDIPIEAGRWAWGCHATCTGEVIFTRTEESTADAAACEMDPYELEQPDADCAACGCANCLDELNACAEEAGCLDLLACAIEADCSGDGCLEEDACMAELDGVEGGTAGMALMVGLAWGECGAEMCPDDCTAPVNDGSG